MFVAMLGACGDGEPAATDVVDRPCGQETPRPGSALAGAPTITFGASSQALRIEIADDDQEQRTGLMNRGCLGDDWGMIFVYGGDVQSTFWMHNTYIPLSIAFIAADGTILEIEDMEPETENSHAGPGPFRWAIEANQGWFSEHGIEVGDVATIPENLSGS